MTIKQKVLEECKRKLHEDWKLDESMLDYAIDLTISELIKELEKIIKPYIKDYGLYGLKKKLESLKTKRR